MSVKTLSLLGLAAVLAFLLYLDSSGVSDSGTSTSVALRQRNIENYARIVKAEQAINRAYQAAALPYAERVALLDSFVADNDKPEQAVEDVLRRVIGAYDVSVESLSVATPRVLGDGVFWVDVDVALQSFSSEDIWKVFLLLADKQRGFAWTSFDFKAEQAEKAVYLSGQLAVVLVQAVE